MALLGVPAAAVRRQRRARAGPGAVGVAGVGFGVLTVTGSAAAAALVGAERRGEAIGVYGLAVALPNLVLLPAGPWVAEHVGFWVVFVAQRASPVRHPGGAAAGRRAARRLPGAAARAGDATVRTEDPQGAAYRRLLRPTALLASVTVAGGAALTFAPQMAHDELLAAVGLLVMGLVSALGRWRVGRLADRYGVQRFLWPLVRGHRRRRRSARVVGARRRRHRCRGVPRGPGRARPRLRRPAEPHAGGRLLRGVAAPPQPGQRGVERRVRRRHGARVRGGRGDWPSRRPSRRRSSWWRLWPSRCFRWRSSDRERRRTVGQRPGIGASGS